VEFGEGALVGNGVREVVDVEEKNVSGLGEGMVACVELS